MALRVQVQRLELQRGRRLEAVTLDEGGESPPSEQPADSGHEQPIQDSFGDQQVKRHGTGRIGVEHVSAVPG